MSVYHFTDTARLPFILKSGALKPGRNKIGGYPDPDFLWATTQAVGDRTASAGSQAYRQGKTRLVRFMFGREHFRPWRQLVKNFPQWTPFHIERLERAAHGLSNPADWFCRDEPLALSEALAVETRSWRSGWAPLESREVALVEGMPGFLAMLIQGKAYLSKEIEASGTQGYQVLSAPADTFLAGVGGAR